MPDKELEKTTEEAGFEVEELDDSDLEDVAGGVADTNNCDCTINNCACGIRPTV